MSIFESFYGVNVEQPRRSAMPDLPMKPPRKEKPKPLRKKRKPEPGFFSRLGKLATGKAKIKKRVRSGPDGLVLKKRKRRKRS